MKYLILTPFIYFWLFGLNIPNETANSARFSPPNECKRMPIFSTKIGFDLQRSAFSTSERKVKGLVFIEFSKDGDANKNKIYQPDSWKQAGAMGPIIIDEEGNVFAAPVPMINTLDNPSNLQNILYKLDSRTGDMANYIALPDYPSAEFKAQPEQNPFGLLGLAYDCDTKTIYATSVKGSSRDEETGCVWAVRKSDKSIISTAKKIDAMGIGTTNINTEKRLFVGKTRNGEIISYPLNTDGSIKTDSARLETSLEGLGPRGDDRARKIRFNERNEMVIQGIEFYYNLIAPTEKQETVYVFRYNPNTQRWIFVRYGA